MSYKDGWAALKLEMPNRVPRMEFSLNYHHALISEITGTQVNADSPPELLKKVTYEAMRKWNYDLIWRTLIGRLYLNGIGTSMGHATFANNGSDFRNDKHSTFSGDLEEVYNFQPLEKLKNMSHSEMAEMFSKHYEESCADYPDAVNMTGTYGTIISGLLFLFGWDLLLEAMGTDPVRFGELTNRYAQWLQPYFNAMADSTAECIMVHDDIVWSAGPFANPAWYREYIFPNYKKYIAPLLDAKKVVLYTSDGNYSVFIDDIAKTGFMGFVMEPSTDMAYIAEKYGRTHSFIGNADTRVLMFGSKQDIYNEVKRCMDIGKKYPGFFMAVGNHISPNTPVENALYYNEVYEKLGKR
ncbi:MAG: hypothetical protein FWD78_03755 [Treponema sp.]|nr:hypothetical protein [Treponema sp.]